MNIERGTDIYRSPKKIIALVAGKALLAGATTVSMLAEALETPRLDVEKMRREHSLDHDRREQETLVAVGQKFIEKWTRPEAGAVRSLTELDPVEKARLARIALETGLGSWGIARAEASEFAEQLKVLPLENEELVINLVDAELPTYEIPKSITLPEQSPVLPHQPQLVPSNLE